MCRVFCVIAVSFQLVAQVPELAWQQWAKEVRQHVASQRWYEAKRVLATLEASDKARFEHEQFTTTLAWIHLHHKYYESAAFHYARLDTKHPELALEHARSLIGCQDFDLAHQVLASIPDRLCDRFQLLEKSSPWRTAPCKSGTTGSHFSSCTSYAAIEHPNQPASPH